MGQENRLLAADENPLRDYMQGRQQDYSRDYYVNAGTAGLSALAALGLPILSGFNPAISLLSAGSLGPNMLVNLLDMQKAGNNYDMAGRGAQMWSGTGMPGRPMAPTPDINRLLQGN